MGMMATRERAGVVAHISVLSFFHFIRFANQGLPALAAGRRGVKGGEQVCVTLATEGPVLCSLSERECSER